MRQRDANAEAGRLAQAMPRYVMYPSASAFHDGVGEQHFDDWLAALPADAELAVSVHVPFCVRLCQFCASRTQRVEEPQEISDYVAAVAREAARVAQRLPRGAIVSWVHWGGGTPTLLSPTAVDELAQALSSTLRVSPDAEFSAEIDPVAMTPATRAALVAAGLTRAVVGVQDFSPTVQAAIGRAQSREATEATVHALALDGVGRLTIEMLYGLPRQTVSSLADVSRSVLALGPDRVAVRGYAHVPAIARRQRMIPDVWLPDLDSRSRQNRCATRMMHAAGYRAVSIYDFVREGDPLADAVKCGTLHRAISGPVPRTPAAEIGLGAGAVSRFSQGYVRNVAQTVAYLGRIAAGRGGGATGYVFTLEDRVRARAIEMLTCGFALDLRMLVAEFGDAGRIVGADCARARDTFPDVVALTPERLRIRREPPTFARLVARLFDRHTLAGAPHAAR